MGQALYRKYRSKSLDEIVGQSHVTDILRRALASGNVAHAYLLTGPRGVGKTSIARILAHEINGLPYEDESTHLDIIEIDAASNNSVEDIRDLREKVLIAPAAAKKKIYIIDEVHMLSKSAFNALLKTLEEPPEHVVFILATTDADKLPATIISRVQRFNFRTIGSSDIQAHLRTIADAEAIAIADEALALIARHGNGSFRDSISLLDQLQSASDETITSAHIERVLGLAGQEAVETLITAYTATDLATIVATLDELESRGTPAVIIASQLIHVINSRIATEPALLPLLDALLDVPKSAWPHVKLLVALTAPISSQLAPSIPVAVPAPKAAPKVSAPTPAPKPVAKAEKKEQTVEPAAEEAPAKAPNASVEFAWDKFLTRIKEKSTGAHSILAKCGYEFDGTTLTIYAGKKFPKAQLDKVLPMLAATLQAFGVADGNIEILASPKPPEDTQTAAILDIMGGGEEVSL